MTILLLGATGRTGKHVLETLLEQNHTVHALVRNKSKVSAQSSRLILFEGDTTNEQTLSNAMKGCEAIISVLNVSRTSDFPWSKLRTPTNLLSRTMTNILQVASTQSINKIIVCSAWGVHETKKEIPAWFRWFINNSNIGPAYKDHEKQEDLLRNSPFDFTIVRPVGLTNSTKQQSMRTLTDNSSRPKLTISRKSVAKFMVQQLTSNDFSRKAVTISQA